MTMTDDKVISHGPPTVEDRLKHFMGGSPLAVIGRLALLSILVGVLLQIMGLDPLNIFNSVQELVRRLWSMGFETVRWLARYLVLGAVIVVPIWFVLRLARAPFGK
jgi:hypothetical protein